MEDLKLEDKRCLIAGLFRFDPNILAHLEIPMRIIEKEASINEAINGRFERLDGVSLIPRPLFLLGLGALSAEQFLELGFAEIPNVMDPHSMPDRRHAFQNGAGLNLGQLGGILSV